MQQKQIRIKIYSLLTSLLCLPTVFFAQSPAQQQKLTNLTRELIATYRSDDTVQYQKFITSQTTEKKITDFTHQFNKEHAHLGDIHLYRIKIVSPTETEALVQTPKYEAWWRVVLITDSLQNYKEHHMGIVRVTDEVLKSGSLTPAQISSRIESYLRRQAKFEEFKGNVFIGRSDTAIYSKSFGLQADGKPNTAEQQFSLASVGKLFTAISILQLADKGQLSLTDKVGDLLPRLRNKKLTNITLHQLLTHTSGMGDFFEDPAFQSIIDSTKNSATHVVNTRLSATDAFLPFIEKDSLLFSPGTSWRYSNTGFELLGMILEKTTGVSYKEYVTEHIFRPAHMKNSVPGSGAGGGLSTIADLAQFSKALRSNLLLSQSLTTKFLTFKENDFYGYGSEHQLLGGEHITGHSGGFENVCNELNMYEHSGYTVIILSNGNPPFGHFLSDKIKELLIRKKEVNNNSSLQPGSVK